MPERFAQLIEASAGLRPGCLACAAVTLALLIAAPAVAQTTRYWAPDAGTGGSGVWNDTDLFWAPNADGSGTKVAWNSTLTNNWAHFGGTASTVTTGAAVSTNQIRFDTTGYLLAGDATNTITLNGSTPQVLLADGVAAEISARLAGSAGFSTGASGTTGGTLTLSGQSSLTGLVGIGAGQTVLATGGSLTAGTLEVGTGVAGATATLRIKSDASMSFSAESRIGTNLRPTAAVVQEGGTASFVGALILGTNTSSTTYTGSSSYTLEAGSLNLTNSTNSFITVGRNATATFTQTGGTVTISRTSEALTIGDYGSGTYTISSGTLSAIGSTSSHVLVGNRGGSGTLSIDGSDALVRVRGALMLANNDTDASDDKGSASITLAQGTLAVNGLFKGRQVRSNGYGDVTFTLSGGTLRPYNANVSFGWSDASRNVDITLSGTAGTISGLDASAEPVARTVDLYANLIGTGGVTLSGGTINLRGANTYAGGTTIGAGTVNVLATSAVPATGSYTILSGGTFADSSGFATVGGWLASGRVATASAGTLAFTAATASEVIDLTGYDSLILATTGTTEVSGTVTPSATGLRIGGSGTLTISSAIGGSAGLTKTGSSRLVLAGDNTFTGPTTVSAGSLDIGSGGTSGSLAGDLVNDSTVRFNRSDDLAYAGAISGTGGLTKLGIGRLTLSGANSYEGITTISTGTLEAGSAAALGSGGQIAFAGGTLRYGSGVTTDFSGRIASTAGQNVRVDVGGQTVEWATGLSGAGTALTRSGAGTLTLAGANTHTGGTILNGNGETVVAATGSLAGSGSILIGTDAGTSSLRIRSGATVAASAFAIGNATIPNAAVIQEGGNVTVSTALQMANSGAAGTYAGSSTYQLQSGSMTFTGSAFIQVGRNATSSFTQSGGTITIARSNNDALIVGDYAAGSYTISAGSLTATSGGARLVLGNRGGSGTLTIDGPTARMGFNGAGRFANNDSGSSGSSATVNLLAGELAINSMSKLSSTGVVNFTLGGGTLRPYGTSVATFGSATADNNFEITLSGTGSVISGLDAAETPVARTVEIRTPLVGSGGVTLSGGTLNLRADNTHAGPTTIAPDTFVDLFGSFASSSAITVNGTLDLTGKTTGFAFGSDQTLGGAGTVALPTTGPGVSLAGFLAPGNSPGTLTLSGAGTFDLTDAINGNTGRLLFELGTPGLSAASDLLLVPDGTLEIGESLLGFDSFAFTPLAGFGPGTYPLFSADSISGLLDPARTTGSLGGLSAELTATGTTISIVVVPEPAAIPLAGAGMVAAAFALCCRRAGRKGDSPPR